MFTVFFFSGLALGGVWGVREGARRPLAVSNTRLRINSVLNSVTRRGTFIGNSAGVMGKFVFDVDLLQSH
jgi:import inner membrane translocase subunit TIM23